MDRERWNVLMIAVRRASREIHDEGRRPLWPNWLIVAMELWRVSHGKPHTWACCRWNYNGLFRPRKRTDEGRSLPSVSQFTRRVKTEIIQKILQRVDDILSNRHTVAGVRYVDGKAMTVSPVSKDPEAKCGHVSGGFAKGYKLHLFAVENRRILAWSVMPLNVSELTVATQMLEHLAPAQISYGSPGLTMGDSNYDSAPLHKAMAATTGDRLLTPLKGQERTSESGHHEATLRQMGLQRREALNVWKEHKDLARYVLKQRNNVEGVFSVLVMGGLNLPPHVRRLARVRRWAGVNIILYHAGLIAEERTKAA